jgi:hypothetical protein
VESRLFVRHFPGVLVAPTAAEADPAPGSTNGAASVRGMRFKSELSLSVREGGLRVFLASGVASTRSVGRWSGEMGGSFGSPRSSVTVAPEA